MVVILLMHRTNGLSDYWANGLELGPGPI